ncbi:MAG: hypothetical protein CMG74_04485 [Candidatus Marinimicrobia bacterium]|nr:hypothetical protein [Candidatus Neomarinimicrobiota bacterium]|tara:strand:+ start:464 stop:1480 length:1017 start_codon:yes stop_codon:yes gene_type:complete
MRSVFNVAQPNFSIAEASDLVYSHYGIRCLADELYSERDQNFYIVAENNKKYVLKISNPVEDISSIQMQIDCTNHIQQQDPNLNIPFTIKSSTGNHIITHNIDGNDYYIRMVTFIKGIFLKDHHQNKDMLFFLGSFMARLDSAMHGFNHPAVKRKFAWNLSQHNFLKNFSKELDSGQDREIVQRFLYEAHKYFEQHKRDIRFAVIHNDGNDHNILIDDLDDKIGIIDFGDMGYSYQVAEPAVAMAYVAIDSDDPLNSMGQILKGYHEFFQLSEKELKFTIYLVCLRLSISVTMASYRKKLFSENKYITISESSAWKFLRSMNQKDLKEISESLYEFVN